MPTNVSDITIVLVGPGRAGRAFARSWTRAGGSILLAARNAAAARVFAREIERAQVVELDDRLRLSGDVVLLAVPDDAIAPLASRLSPRAGFRFAFHLSGALASRELAPLSTGGAALGSIHPLRAFSGSPEDVWEGAFVAVEGEESAAATAIRLCRRVGARPSVVASAGKPLYHAAATLAAGGSGAILSFATRLWKEAGLPEEEGRAALAGLAAGAVDAVGRFPFERALTGPVARRDIETVRLHSRVLEPWPEIRDLYSILARETLRRTSGRGQEDVVHAIVGGLEDRSTPLPAPNGEESDDRRRNG